MTTPQEAFIEWVTVTCVGPWWASWVVLAIAMVVTLAVKR